MYSGYKLAVLISGVPGTGKTTLMKNIIKNVGDGYESFKIHKPEKLVPVMTFNVLGETEEQQLRNINIVGVYEDTNDVFQGSDKTSMAIQPDFEKWVSEKAPNLLIEGDRLVGGKTIDFLLNKGYDVHLYILEATDLDYRYKERGSEQSETFLKSKDTKVSKLASRMDLIISDSIHIVNNNNLVDLDNLTEEIIDKFKEALHG